MNIAVFADVHGRILLAFKLCARWERETGQHIDLILQAGDMGIFPTMERVDKATLRHAANDPTELGFLDYFTTRNATATQVLAQTTCDLIFVRGNHEDHAWLDAREQQAPGPLFAIDPYQRLFCLKTGIPYTYSVGAEHMTILGIGRIASHSQDARPGHETGIQPHEQAKLAKLGDIPIDILLTHDMPVGPLIERRSMGMPEITDALQRYRPSYHFYGHVGGHCKEGTATNGITHFCKLADLEWHGQDRVLHAGSMAILQWTDRATHTFTVLDEPWLNGYTAHTWLHL